MYTLSQRDNMFVYIFVAGGRGKKKKGSIDYSRSDRKLINMNHYDLCVWLLMCACVFFVGGWDYIIYRS